MYIYIYIYTYFYVYIYIYIYIYNIYIYIYILIEEALVCPSFVFVLKLTHNSKIHFMKFVHEVDLAIISQFQYKHEARTYESFFNQYVCVYIYIDTYMHA
jgi:hypothetical protein